MTDHLTQKTQGSLRRLGLAAGLVAATLLVAPTAADKAERKSDSSAKAEKKKGDRVKLNLDLPKPVFTGTPKQPPEGTSVKLREGPRDPYYVPPGLKNLAKGKPVTSSTERPIIGELGYATDGTKKGLGGSYVELGFGKQWVQIDLKQRSEIYAIVVWHRHDQPRVYHDVVVQVADDKDFVKNVKTVFNNDRDNSLGLGVGKNREYFETNKGKLIRIKKGVTGRYVRLYSNGSTADDMNHYTEVEVWGRPVGQASK